MFDRILENNELRCFLFVSVLIRMSVTWLSECQTTKNADFDATRFYLPEDMYCLSDIKHIFKKRDKIVILEHLDW